MSRKLRGSASPISLVYSKRDWDTFCNESGMQLSEDKRRQLTNWLMEYFNDATSHYNGPTQKEAETVFKDTSIACRSASQQLRSVFNRTASNSRSEPLYNARRYVESYILAEQLKNDAVISDWQRYWNRDKEILDICHKFDDIFGLCEKAQKRFSRDAKLGRNFISDDRLDVLFYRVFRLIFPDEAMKMNISDKVLYFLHQLCVAVMPNTGKVSFIESASIALAKIRAYGQVNPGENWRGKMRARIRNGVKIEER